MTSKYLRSSQTCTHVCICACAHTPRVGGRYKGREGGIKAQRTSKIASCLQGDQTQAEEFKLGASTCKSKHIHFCTHFRLSQLTALFQGFNISQKVSLCERDRGGRKRDGEACLLTYSCPESTGWASRD